jgi:hypothetical protein
LIGRREQLGDLSVIEKIILKIVLKEIGCEVVDWMRLIQNTAHWRTFVNTAMTFLVP